jgi:drug/metabolite transporter (DMT)-like permease
MHPPAADRARPEAQTWALFVALALVWGSSFLFIKIGLDEGLAPFTLVTLRLAIATVFLAVSLWLGGGRLPRNRDAWQRLVVVAVINVALPFTLLTWGAQFIPSAVTAIGNATVPLFAIVIASLVLHDEPITLNRLVGLLVGFVGAILLVSPNLGEGGGSSDTLQALVGELAVAGASLSYACGAVYIRHRITGQPLIDDPVTGPRPMSPVEVALPQVAIAGVITAALAAVTEQPAASGGWLPPSLAAWFAVAWLGMLGSGVAYMLYFRLIRAWGATRTTLVTYVMPIVGITLGVIILGEQLHVAEIAGAALIIGGLVFANAQVGQRRLFGRAAQPVAAPARSEASEGS